MNFTDFRNEIIKQDKSNFRKCIRTLSTMWQDLANMRWHFVWVRISFNKQRRAVSLQQLSSLCYSIIHLSLSATLNSSYIEAVNETKQKHFYHIESHCDAVHCMSVEHMTAIFCTTVGIPSFPLTPSLLALTSLIPLPLRVRPEPDRQTLFQAQKSCFWRHKINNQPLIFVTTGILNWHCTQ